MQTFQYHALSKSVDRIQYELLKGKTPNLYHIKDWDCDIYIKRTYGKNMYLIKI